VWFVLFNECICLILHKDVWCKKLRISLKNYVNLAVFLTRLPLADTLHQLLQLLIEHEPLAQVVEQQPFKLWVDGSSPSRLTMFPLRGFAWRVQPSYIVCPHRLARSRTLPFHGKNKGSNPFGDAISNYCFSLLGIGTVIEK
jgi:hypothetical protein